MNYGIANKNTILINEDANTTKSRYGAVEFTTFRRFATRAAARNYKRTRKNPSQYSIIQLATNTIVR
jgi:hypothetical protein